MVDRADQAKLEARQMGGGLEPMEESELPGRDGMRKSQPGIPWP